MRRARHGILPFSVVYARLTLLAVGARKAASGGRMALDGMAEEAHLLTRKGAEGRARARSPGDTALPLLGPDGLDRHVRRDLRKQEIAVARRVMSGRMLPYAVAPWGCFAVWLSFFPLAIMGWLNLPLAFVLSCIFATGGYVTSHEAMHSNIARPHSRHYWINEWVGKVSTIPIVFPFSMARLMHLEHHYHCNDPQ